MGRYRWDWSMRKRILQRVDEVWRAVMEVGGVRDGDRDTVKVRT